MIVSGCISQNRDGIWDDVARHWQDPGPHKKFLSATGSPVARPREGLGTVTVTMNQRGHGNKQDTFPFLFRAVFFLQNWTGLKFS